jgi:RNA polymerase sigma factor (sigma-70 family)
VQAYADSELVHDLARDVEFERMYRRYARDVYRYTLAVLRNPADAEDITQTTFLNAYRAYLRGEEPLKPRHWLIKIAHNACRSRHLRAVRRPQEVPLEETIAAVGVPASEASKVEELLAALGRLPFNQRAALVMRELEGRSYAEIADTLEVSVSAVETLIFRARRTLRRDRSLLGALGAVQLPPSLAGFVTGGSGAVAGGGAAAAAGSGVLFKILIAVMASVFAGTVGTGVDKVLADNARSAPTAALEPEATAAFTSPIVGGPAITGLRGPIVVMRTSGGRVIVMGGAFGAAPSAALIVASVGGVAASKAGAWPGSMSIASVLGGDSAAAAPGLSDPPPASRAPPAPPLPASAAAPAATTTAPVTDTVSDTVSDTTSAPPAPNIPVPSAPATPSPPAVPPPPVPTPPVATPPVATPPVPSVPVPDVPSPPEPPHIP